MPLQSITRGQTFGITDFVNNTKLNNLGVPVIRDAVKVVATRAAMKALTVADFSDGEVVETLACTTAGDGGGGVFRYTAASSATDDGGITVAPNSGSGRWIRIFSGPVNVRWFGAVGDGSSDDTTSIQKALDSGYDVEFPKGEYKISNEVTPVDNQTIFLSSSVQITQSASETNIFFVNQKSGVWIFANGAVLYGKGTWSSAWTGNDGHEDKAVNFVGCDNCGIVKPVIKNCGAAGIAIIGGYGILVDTPYIEGTNLLGTPLASEDNFQNGIYLTNDATYGPADMIRILNPEITQTAQGILVEARPGVTRSRDGITIVSPYIHDIPGQHAFYLQAGDMSITGAVCRNIELSAVKIQIGNNGIYISDITVAGLIASEIGSQVFEIVQLSTGDIKNLNLMCTASNVSRGLTISGAVENVHADVVFLDVSQDAVLIQGASVKDISVRVSAQNVGKNGVLITATNSSGIKLFPTIRECNTLQEASNSGIHIQSATAQVDIFNPDVSDADTHQVYGLFNETSGATVRVYGSARFTGASDTAVRTAGKITEWPTDTTLSGTNGQFNGLQLLNSSQTMKFTKRTTSSSNELVWGLTLDDESAYCVNVELTGKLSGSAQRAAYKFMFLAYRDGGGATIQGSASTLASIASASFAGAYSVVTDTNNVNLVANSGGVANYDWTARVTITPVT